MTTLITGSCGLIGSEAVLHYTREKHRVIGIDNNLRKYFFGEKGDTQPTLQFLMKECPNYTHLDDDIRNREAMFQVFEKYQPELVIHCASQPSHDWAAREPFTDFEVNATATLNLLEATRQKAPDAIFIFMSTNKVYGDAPNFLPLEETRTRYEYTGKRKERGIDEGFTVDQSLHSLFGASKLSADILCQEYGRYFGLKIGIFRGGCLTGSRHAGVELHGYLNYLVDCAVAHRPYRIFGYKSKQVRDQIHSSDVIQTFELFKNHPRCGEVYNLGGGFHNSASMYELIQSLREEYGLKLETHYEEKARRGDHICYYSDLSKLNSHYPKFRIQWTLKDILQDMVEAAKWKHRKAA